MDNTKETKSESYLRLTLNAAVIGIEEKAKEVKFLLIGMMKNRNNLWVQKITIATLKNRLSLNFTLWNIESAANPTKKTIAAHTWVHLPF